LEDVKGVIHNPVYTGMGAYPVVVDESVWVKSAIVAIEEEGTEEFLRRMLAVLRAAMDLAAANELSLRHDAPTIEGGTDGPA
jgi:hypothetical protein